MGTAYDWFHGYHLFVLNEVVYLSGKYTPTRGVEILGSEFDAAVAAHKASSAEEK